MTISFVIFFVLAAIAVTAALGMLLSPNALYSVLFLIINFGAIAVFYLLLSAPFIAIAQITVYAGAIMVLFLFVIMLLGAEKLPDANVLPWQRPAALGLSLLLLLEAGVVIFTRLGNITAVESVPPAFGDPKAIGGLLFNQYLLPFEVTSILLLVAIIGAIVLTKPEHRETKSIKR